MEWQPIETAPKERHKHILLFGDGPSIEQCCYVGYVTDVWGPEEWREMTGRLVVQPTHWMPLPETPNSDIEGKDNDG